MKGVFIFNPSDDIAFVWTDGELHLHLKKIAIQRGQDSPNDDELDENFLLQFLFPIVASQRSLISSVLNTSFQSIIGENGFIFSFMMFDEHIYMAINGDKKETESFLRRKLIALQRILTFLHGPILDELKPQKHLRSERWSLIGQLLDKWCHLYQTEQSFLVEAVDHLRLNSDIRRKFISLLKTILLRFKSSADRYATHALITVDSRLLAFYSSNTTLSLDSSDTLLIILLVNTIYSPNNQHTVESSQANQPIKTTEPSLSQTPIKTTEPSPLHAPIKTTGKTKTSRSAIVSDATLSKVSIGSTDVSHSVTASYEISNIPEVRRKNLDAETSSDSSKHQSIAGADRPRLLTDNADISDKSIIYSRDIVEESDRMFVNCSVRSCSANSNPVVYDKVNSQIYEYCEIASSESVDDEQTRCNQFSEEGEKKEGEGSDKEQTPGDFVVLENNLSRSAVDTVYRRQVVFLHQPSLRTLPHVLHCLQLAPGSTLILISEIHSQHHADALVRILIAAQLSSRDGTHPPDATELMRIIDKCMKKLVDVPKLYGSSMDDAWSGLTKLWSEMNKPEFIKELDLRTIASRDTKTRLSRGSTQSLEDSPARTQMEHQFKTLYRQALNLFRVLFFNPRVLSVDDERRLTNMINVVHKEMNETLADFQNFLPLASVSFTAYPSMYPGLVHFLYVNRTYNEMTAPSFSFTQEMHDSDRARLHHLKSNIWRLQEKMFLNVGHGLMSMSVRIPPYYYNFNLWFEDQTGNTVPVQVPFTGSVSKSMSYNGTVSRGFHKRLVRSCFPHPTSTPVECHELMCVHDSTVPLEVIDAQCRLLATRLANEKRDVSRVHIF